MNTILATFLNAPLSATDLTHNVWQKCQTVQITQDWSGTNAVPERHAEAAIVWTPDSLNVRFNCHQHEPLVVTSNPVTDRKTLGLWDRDVCEIFVAPDRENTSRYFEFEAAPTGEWIDLGIQITPEGRLTDWDFISGMTTAAEFDGSRLIIGMKIPWSNSIPKPHSGEKWGVNLFRCVGPESPTRYLAWLPTRTPEPNFHVPEVFGELQFG